MAGHMTLGGLYLTLAYRSLLTQHVLSICQLFANADSAKAVRRDLDSRTETSLVSASTKRSPIHPSQPAQERASLLAKAREGKPNGQLQFQQLLNSESFEVVSGASLNASPNPMPKGLNESEQNNGHRPKPLLTAAFTDAIFNTTILRRNRP